MLIVDLFDQYLFTKQSQKLSQVVHEYKQLWVVVQKTDENGSIVSSAGCSCMAGYFETCNHIIAIMYKIEYAHTKGWCNLVFTEALGRWNRKEVEAKRITDLLVTKKLGSRQ